MGDLRKDITKIVEEILYVSHKDDEKRRLDTSKEEQLEMACPCCGDSKTNTTKKRGILYLDTFIFFL